MSSFANATAFRKVLGSFLTGVTVVTTSDGAGGHQGITANSFTSVSLDPPLVLFCIGKQSSSCAVFTESPGYNIHILRADQRELATQFTRGTPEEKFAGVEIRKTETGAPLIEGVGSWLACRTMQVIDAGDHYILLGEVYECGESDYRPLGFFQSQFQTFRMGEEIAQYSHQSGAKVTVAWILETEDRQVVLRQDAQGRLEIPKVQMSSAKISDENLAGRAKDFIGAEADIDFLFSMYEAADESLILIYRGVIRLAADGRLGSGMRLVDLEQLEHLDVADPIEKSILGRYDRERAEARFSVYSGSHREGAVARVDRVEHTLAAT